MNEEKFLTCWFVLTLGLVLVTFGLALGFIFYQSLRPDDRLHELTPYKLSSPSGQIDHSMDWEGLIGLTKWREKYF